MGQVFFLFFRQLFAHTHLYVELPKYHYNYERQKHKADDEQYPLIPALGNLKLIDLDLLIFKLQRTPGFQPGNLHLAGRRVNRVL